MTDIGMDSIVSIQPHMYFNHSSTCSENGPLSTANILPCRGNITPQVVQRVEMELEFYEKVSMVFLLYENVDVALQFLKAAESAERNSSCHSGDLLFKWACNQANCTPHWETKFLESLCIIQNYEVVEKLGYHKNDVFERFLPSNGDISLYVDLMRKALYVMCEKLTLEQSKRLINLVTLDLGDEFPSLSSRDEPDYLEMHILFWLSQKYFVIQNRNVDLSNITKHLKKMGELELIDYLDAVAKRYGRFVDTYGDDQVSECASSIGDPDHSVVSTTDTLRYVSQTSTHYDINPKSIGYCLIINQKMFYKETNPRLLHLLAPEKLEVRTGTDKDRDSLIEAFGNFGFKLIIWNNLTHVELLKTIEESIDKLVDESHSCFALCILSHGKKDAVYGVNSIPVPVSEIENCIHSRKLLGKPKLLIIQACQGQDQQDAIPCSLDIAIDGPLCYRQTRPQISDMLTLWSTVPGYASFRDKVRGSWYIQTLCDHLLNCKDKADIMDVALAVNNSIQSRYAVFEGEMKTMQPQFTVTLSKKLVLPCSREARKAIAERMTLRYLFDAMLKEYLQLEYRNKYSPNT